MDLTASFAQLLICVLSAKVTALKVWGSSWLIKGNKKKGKTNPDGISGRLQE